MSSSSEKRSRTLEEEKQDMKRRKLAPDSKKCNNEHDVWGPGSESVESMNQWRKCIKNPGHKNFIPVGQFGIKHLPMKCQKDDFVEWIKTWFDMTVRLRVNHTSSSRPKDGGFYDMGGPRVGTGFVYRVEPTTRDHQYCVSKLQPGQGQRLWAFRIVTAKHVVFDDEEVKETIVDFFYDQPDSDKVRTLSGVKVLDTREDKDWCSFLCICHDRELASKILHQRDECNKLWRKLEDWIGSIRSRPSIIISHPHGRPKHVTVGEVTGSREGIDSDYCSYTADTCPGSSGAFNVGWPSWALLPLVIKKWPRRNLRNSYFGVHHCQGGRTNKGCGNFWRV